MSSETTVSITCPIWDSKNLVTWFDANVEALIKESSEHDSIWEKIQRNGILSYVTMSGKGEAFGFCAVINYFNEDTFVGALTKFLPALYGLPLKDRAITSWQNILILSQWEQANFMSLVELGYSEYNKRVTRRQKTIELLYEEYGKE